jgi:type III secretion system FlhB-like substrate exporter
MDKKRELKDRQAIALTYEPGTSAPAIVRQAGDMWPTG